MGNPIAAATTPQLDRTAKPAVPARLASIDVFRGFVMVLMMAEVLELAKVSAALPASAFWAFLAKHQTHVEWGGCILHDLIQPGFSFLVGVALPFSLARRKAEGQAQLRLTLHAFYRALLLVLLGVFLRSLNAPQTNWTFVDTLTQIGLGYGFLYMLAWRTPREQWAAFIAILFGYWLFFVVFPLPKMVDPPFSMHWAKNNNYAAAFDLWFLNLFPRATPFTGNPGGYCTLNFIPTIATMILGLFAGEVLRGPRAPWQKVAWFAIAGAIGLAAGMFFDKTGICPSVKRIWTPSWVLFSGGWCFILMGAFYLVVDVWNRRAWALPLVVVGMNSIAAYMIAHLCPEFIKRTLQTHLGFVTRHWAGSPYEPFLIGAVVLALEWVILLWMYRRKIFLKI
ncbi:DUF5009 domain-containing protein [bacterium]|nr:DUF5009 domain-containing protein [bacterium]